LLLICKLIYKFFNNICIIFIRKFTIFKDDMFLEVDILVKKLSSYYPILFLKICYI